MAERNGYQEPGLSNEDAFARINAFKQANAQAPEGSSAKIAVNDLNNLGNVFQNTLKTHGLSRYVKVPIAQLRLYHEQNGGRRRRRPTMKGRRKMRKTRRRH
jgi:hypothetical protein